MTAQIIPNSTLVRNTERQLHRLASRQYSVIHSTRLLCPRCGVVRRVTGVGHETGWLVLSCGHIRASCFRFPDDVEAIEEFKKEYS